MDILVQILDLISTFLLSAGGTGGFYCGGALISKHYALTGLLNAVKSIEYI